MQALQNRYAATESSNWSWYKLLLHCVVWECEYVTVSTQLRTGSRIVICWMMLWRLWAHYYYYEWCGIGIRVLMRGMATLPQGNQELLVASCQRQSWKNPRWAWGKQVHGMWYFSLQCFDTVGWATGRTSGLYKNWVLVCWWWWFDWSFARFVAPVVTTTSIILCFNRHRLT